MERVSVGLLNCPYSPSDKIQFLSCRIPNSESPVGDWGREEDGNRGRDRRGKRDREEKDRCLKTSSLD